MSKKQAKPVVRKPNGKIADAQKVRYGSGMSPASLVRAQDAATADVRKVRFGSGMAPASLRK